MTATYHEPSEARRLAPAAAPADQTNRVAATGRKREMVRAVNAQICLLAQPLSDTSADRTRAYFVCECPDESCVAVVPMTLTEWQAATSEAGYYVAHPQHVPADDQAVVATHGYALARAVWPGERA